MGFTNVSETIWENVRLEQSNLGLGARVKKKFSNYWLFYDACDQTSNLQAFESPFSAASQLQFFIIFCRWSIVQYQRFFISSRMHCSGVNLENEKKSCNCSKLTKAVSHKILRVRQSHIIYIIIFPKQVTAFMEVITTVFILILSATGSHGQLSNTHTV